ncbi:hypothetical protein HBN76_06265 [Pseudomonas sp. WS 5013]|uniref:phage tail length tape measure family protein n=1 Tax=Pseudomonas sp. WS 5013 TaxID=2717475 RepID=UPI00147451CC|nr:phage tail length tape measure family protein [Pseudomonas sp. WS 5013]NMY40901.1 hypothetical protein [Pseudomonas sp. WS 5013]
MAKRDLELALRVKADMEEARAQLQGLGGDVAAIGVDARTSTASMAKFNAVAGSQAATMRAAAMTAGQYQQAMRQLPMQITDITTSLASGMPLWMVAIQQGGQIRDSFGGIGNAGRALMTTLNPLTLAIGAAVAATTGLLLAYQQGGKEGYEFNKAIIMTGNSAGTSADQLANMAARIDGISGTQRQAAAALAEVTNAGKFTAEQIEKIATTAVVMENTIGKAVSDTVTEFKRLADEPAQAAAELNEQYNFLTAAVYEQIAALEAQGNEAAAAQLAMDTLASTMQQRAQEIAGNLGLIESAWKGIKNVAAEAWDEMLGIGRDATLEDQLADVQRRRNDARYGVRGDRLGTSIDPETAAALDAEEQRLNLQIQQRDQEAAWAAELAKINEDSIAAQQELAKIREQSLSKVEQKEKAIAEYRANVEKIRAASPDSSLISEDRIAKDIAAIEARYAEREKKARTPKPKVDQELKQQEQYVAQLERQAATLGKNAEEVRQYELAEKGLTGALQARAAVALELINQEERKRLADADGKQLSGMQAQLLSSQGQQAAAAAIQIEQQYGELVKRLQDRGDAAGLDLVNRFINVEQAKAQLEELQAEVDRVFADQGRREQTINTQQQAGLLSEIGAREEILDLNQATTAQIEQLLPKMRELAAVTGDPAAIERLKDMESRLGTLTVEADQFSRSLKAGFETGIQSALQGLATGTMNLREAALSFINSIASSMATMASQELAKMATSGLAGLLGGGQDDANMTAGAAAVTASAGALSVAGSTLVTGAAAIEAAAATLAAANGGGVGGSVVNAGSSSGGSGWLGLITKAASAYFGGGAGGGYTGAYGFAEGGHVRGPGTSTSDSIFAKLSDQEYVVRASVVTQQGMLPLLHDLNARGFAALDDWYGARLAHHSTGGLAGVPAPAMPSPGLGGNRLADPAKSMSATLHNAINLHVYDDPQRIADSAFNSRAGQENFMLMLSRDPARYRSILGIT